MKKKPPGLYANIQAKRARGEEMRKPGQEGAPSAGDFKNAAKTAKKKKGVKREDPKGNPAGYFDKEGCKTCGGGKKPCKCSKKDMVGRRSSYADGYGKKCDSIAAEFNAVMDTEARQDKPCGNSYIPQNAKCGKGAGAAAKKSSGSNPSNYSMRQLQGASPAVQARRSSFYNAKGNTQGIGNKIKRVGEFAANAGSGAAFGAGMLQTLTGIERGSLGMASRGVRNMSLGTAAASLASSSRASRLGNKGLSKSFAKQAGKAAVFGVGQEALLGAASAYKKTGGAKNLGNRMTELRRTASRRAQGVRTYQGGGGEQLPGSKKKRR
jgi:hypothetical protein